MKKVFCLLLPSKCHVVTEHSEKNWSNATTLLGNIQIFNSGGICIAERRSGGGAERTGFYSM